MTTHATKSPALVAMQAAHKALIDDKTPSGLYARTPRAGTANHALSRLLNDLVVHGAHFDAGDIAEIDRTCGAYSTGGKFDIEGVHGAALAVGNASAADSWEQAKGWPGSWAWPGEQTAIVADRNGHGKITRYGRGPALLKRLGATSAILLDGKWWRVYQIGADELRLSQTPGDDGLTLPETRKGILRFIHTRETWAVVVKAERKAAKAKVERQTDEVKS